MLAQSLDDLADQFARQEGERFLITFDESQQGDDTPAMSCTSS